MKEGEKKKEGSTCSLVHSQVPLSSLQLDSLAALVKVNQPNADDPLGLKDIVNLIL